MPAACQPVRALLRPAHAGARERVEKAAPRVAARNVQLGELVVECNLLVVAQRLVDFIEMIEPGPVEPLGALAARRAARQRPGLGQRGARFLDALRVGRPHRREQRAGEPDRRAIDKQPLRRHAGVQVLLWLPDFEKKNKIF